MNGFEKSSAIEAAQELSLMNSSVEWELCLMEAASHAFPVEMRRLFVDILAFGDCLSPSELFHTFKREFAPVRRDNQEDVTPTDIAVALYHMSQLLALHNRKLSDYALPEVDMTLISFEVERQLQIACNVPDEPDHRTLSDDLESSLTSEQRKVYLIILDAVHNMSKRSTQRLYFLQASGGCGKTYIYKYVYIFIYLFL